MKKIIAISGSLRKDSHNTNLLKALVKINQELNNDIEIEIVDISKFPLFNQDIETNYPSEIQNIKDKILNSDGIIFATPEYNRSIPGVIKNAIDWLSRPYGTSPFNQKKALIMGASIGQVGTAIAQSHLKEILLFLNMQLFGQPEIYITFANDKFNTNGELIDEKTKELLKSSLENFLR